MRKGGLGMLRRCLAMLGLAALVVTILSGCGGSAGPVWGIDPMFVGIWEVTRLTEDGWDVLWSRKTMVFRDDGTWRSDTDNEEKSWSTGTYGTWNGKLNYRIDASSNPDNVGDEYTFDYTADAGTMTISGHHLGHYYVSTFQRLEG